MKKALVSWSSGKDSAWLVHVLRTLAGVELGALLTTINEPAQRVAMHAVRLELLEAQAKALALPLWQVPISSRVQTTSTSARWRRPSSERLAKDSPTSGSAIYFWRTCGATAKSGSPELA
jgi:diphthamide synthase (EF-2-diphthine--ammonia ligase)